jgi:hypothetical protein
MRSGIRLFHDHVNVEDVPMRVTHVAGTRAPRLSRQLLHPRDLHAFQSSVLSLNILNGRLHQDTVMSRAPHRCDPRRPRTRTGATGPGCGPPGEIRHRCHETPGARSAAPLDRQRTSPHDGRSRSSRVHASSAPVFGSSKSHASGGHGEAKAPHRRESSGSEARKTAVKPCVPPSVRCSWQNTMETGLTLADLSWTGSPLLGGKLPGLHVAG